ncbi:O-antigen ligase family protein [Crocinitomix sp.]|nr:O-antigen ligase family protein [Crocinitomix sp.]
MVIAYKEHMQFIMILVFMYVIGVWGGPLIYLIYPVFLILFGLRKRYFELFIAALWTLVLSDYVPVDNATYMDLEFAKTLKPLVPIVMVYFFIRDRESFKPYPKLFLYFIPFFIIVNIALEYSIYFQVGLQKNLSFILMYLVVPLVTVYLHRTMGNRFWKALLTFIVGLLTIGIILRFAAPEIAMRNGRYKGVLGNPNGLAIFLNLSFILWMVVRKFELAIFTKRENLFIGFVILLSLVWTESRNGMTSVLLFYATYKLIQVNWFLALVVLAAILAFNDLIFELIIGLIEFFGMQDFFRVDTIEEGSGRIIAWQLAWIKLQDYFFIGGGFGHDEHVMRPNYKMLSMQGHQGGVHNSYLSLWLDSGILGLVAYFGGLIAIVSKAIKHNYIIIAFIASMGFNIYFESWLVGSLNPFTILYLTILTIFFCNLTGADYEQSEQLINDQENQ